MPLPRNSSALVPPPPAAPLVLPAPPEQAPNMFDQFDDAPQQQQGQPNMFDQFDEQKPAAAAPAQPAPKPAAQPIKAAAGPLLKDRPKPAAPAPKPAAPKPEPTLAQEAGQQIGTGLHDLGHIVKQSPVIGDAIKAVQAGVMTAGQAAQELAKDPASAALGAAMGIPAGAIGIVEDMINAAAGIERGGTDNKNGAGVVNAALKMFNKGEAVKAKEGYQNLPFVKEAYKKQPASAAAGEFV